MFDYLVFIGRFQPFHLGHLHVVEEALKKTKHLIIIIGSHNRSRNIRNPFTTNERIAIIKTSLTAEQLARISFAPQYDYTYNDDRWVSSIQASVNAITHNKYTAGPIKVGIVGYDKDHSTFYLKKFPQWEFVSVEPDKSISHINATKFREKYFSTSISGWADFVCSPSALGALLEIQKGDWGDFYKLLQTEYEVINEYKNSWASSPFPPVFMTVDAVVRQSGHLLLVERGDYPGRGLWALPGGFLKEGLTLEETMIEELYEETGLKVPKPVIKGSIHGRRTFDDPYRSDRGRSITEAFDIRLSESFELPKVKGGDDAARAFWIPFSEAEKNRHMFFEDHFAIIQKIIGL